MRTFNTERKSMTPNTLLLDRLDYTAQIIDERITRGNTMQVCMLTSHGLNELTDKVIAHLAHILLSKECRVLVVNPNIEELSYNQFLAPKPHHIAGSIQNIALNKFIVDTDYEQINYLQVSTSDGTIDEDEMQRIGSGDDALYTKYDICLMAVDTEHEMLRQFMLNSADMNITIIGEDNNQTKPIKQLIESLHAHNVYNIGVLLNQ